MLFGPAGIIFHHATPGKTPQNNGYDVKYCDKIRPPRTALSARSTWSELLLGFPGICNQGEDTVVEPASLASFFTIFFTAAMVVLLGALYALLFAFSRVRKMPGLMPLAYTAYGGLFVSALFLAHATHMFNSILWSSIVMILLIGYWLAPHAIWHLCVGTHAVKHECQKTGAKSL